MMNLMPDILKELGVSVNEPFNIIYQNGEVACFSPYHFRDDFTLINSVDVIDVGCLFNLITGRFSIEKIPFKPKVREKYWKFNISANRPVIDTFNPSYTGVLACWALGNCFRTEEEAETKGRELMESILKEYRQDENSN